MHVARGLALAALGLVAFGCGYVGYGARVDGGLDVDADVEPDAGQDAGADAGPPGVDCRGGVCVRVFLSSSGLPSGGFGGVGAADAHCQSLADVAGLGGTFVAWLSDGTTSPATRLVADVPYRLLDGTTIAEDFADLTDGTLAHAIDVDERLEEESEPIEVWTGTLPSGLSATGSCAAWTNESDAMPYGTVGVSDATSSVWTNIYLQFCDRSALRLYCFELLP